VNEYEVYPSLEEGFTYLRHISKNGKSLSPEEIKKQDRKHDKKLNERTQEMEREGADERSRRLAREAEEKRKEDAITDELFQLYDISMTGRDFIEEPQPFCFNSNRERITNPNPEKPKSWQKSQDEPGFAKKTTN